MCPLLVLIRVCLRVLSVAALFLTIPLAEGQALSELATIKAWPVVISSANAAPVRRVDALHLGVLINVRDPESIEIGRYYQAQRHIPDAHVLEVSLDPTAPVLNKKDFASLQSQIEPWAGDRLDAMVFTWRQPYAVDCMSLTAALTLGFDESYCANGCRKTKASAYFRANVISPWHDLRMRPSMMLATANVKTTQALIARGIASDGSRPMSQGFVLKTSDSARSVRANSLPINRLMRRGFATLRVIESDALRAQKDILFYFTGASYVPHLNSNTYLPGAVGDHLTSFGGVVTGGNSQMTALEWLNQGLTGSYGTVVEPCNFPEKFPHPLVMFSAYAGGDTLIEAYWKSVQMPGQGLFVGEPLARPYGP